MNQRVDGLIIERERLQRKIEILKNLKNSDFGAIESNRAIIGNRIHRLQNKKSEITVRIRKLDPSALPDAPKNLDLCGEHVVEEAHFCPLRPLRATSPAVRGRHFPET